MSRPSPFDRTPIRSERVRKIDGSFAFLPHRFLREGFWASLSNHELRLYVLLVIVADRNGMSFYYDDRLAGILRLVLDDLLAARAGLIRKDLIAHDPVGPRTQVLSLPRRPATVAPRPTSRPQQPLAHPAPPAQVRHMIRDILARFDQDRR